MFAASPSQREPHQRLSRQTKVSSPAFPLQPRRGITQAGRERPGSHSTGHRPINSVQAQKDFLHQHSFTVTLVLNGRWTAQAEAPVYDWMRSVNGTLGFKFLTLV